MNYKQCAKLLLTHENILIVTHRNPDGDTVASAAALCSALRRGGRNAYLYPNPQRSTSASTTIRQTPVTPVRHLSARTSPHVRRP